MPSSPKCPARLPERVILFALVGTSPAVLTETLYALARQNPPVVPDEITVVTTAKGREAMLRKLLTPPSPGAPAAWERFRRDMRRRGLDPAGRLAFGEASIRCIPSAACGFLDDVASRDDNRLLADFLLGELRRYTEESGTRLVASLAGGRKTMGALLLSCMTLLARPQDSVCHVLVSPPYDDPRLSPPFFFPDPRLSHVLPGEARSFPSRRARIDLIDLPFVKIRGWYESRHKSPPPSYSALVAHAQSFFPPPAAGAMPFLAFDTAGGLLSADGVPVALGAGHFLALCLFLHQPFLPAPPWEIMWRLHSASLSGAPAWLCRFRQTGRFARQDECLEDFRKTFSALRGRLRGDARLAPFADILAPRLSQYENTARWPAGRMSADIHCLLRLLPRE